MTWDEAVDYAKAQLERMEKCPDGCGHVACRLQDRPLRPGDTWEVVHDE